MIHTDFPAVKIQIALCQTAKLADTHSRSQQHDKFIIILCIGFIFTDKPHPKFLLFLCHGDTLLRIVWHNIYQLKIKWIPADNVLIICHLKSRLYNAPDTCNGTVSFSVIM